MSHYRREIVGGTMFFKQKCILLLYINIFCSTVIIRENAIIQNKKYCVTIISSYDYYAAEDILLTTKTLLSMCEGIISL